MSPEEPKPQANTDVTRDEVATSKMLGDPVTHASPGAAFVDLGESPAPSEPTVEAGCGAFSIGRYTVRRKLGEGGFGSVFLAYDPVLNRYVAIKIPRKEKFSSEQAVASFMLEARTTAALNHPGITMVYDVGRTEDGSCYVVMQLVDGESLEALIKAKRLPFERTVEIMIQVADALSYAHKQGFLHRDLKPGNILIDREGRPYIADFGLAIHELSRRFRQLERVGTPRYMAPELVRGETHRLDGRTDIWSLGVMLYHLLTGRLPFHGENTRELYAAVEQVDPKPPRQINERIPRELERICLKCMAKRMADRYSTASDLADDLRHFRDAELHRTRELAAEPALVESGASARSGSVAADSAPRSHSQASLFSARVVPKGLRAFEPEDAEFFLSLLPGPRDRDGLPERRLRAACVLAGLDAERPRWNEIAGDVAAALCAESTFANVARWIDALQQVRRQLVPSLCTAFRDTAATQTARTIAANVLADYAASEPRRCWRLNSRASRMHARRQQWPSGPNRASRPSPASNRPAE